MKEEKQQFCRFCGKPIERGKWIKTSWRHIDGYDYIACANFAEPKELNEKEQQNKGTASPTPT